MPDTTVEQSDRILMSRIIRGDEEAFAEFFDTNFEPLHSYAHSRAGGDKAVADDVTRRTFSEAVKMMDTWRGQAPVQTWLRNISQTIPRLDTSEPIDHAALREGIHVEWQEITTRRAQKRVFTSLILAIVVAVIILLFNCPA
jgi:hypothetical protein